MKVTPLLAIMVAVTLASICGCASWRSSHTPMDSGGSAPSDTVTITTSCGEYLTPPRFEGRVLGRLPDGTSMPVPGVTFTRAIGEDGLKSGHGWPTTIATDTDGLFDVAVGIGTSSSTWTDKGRVIKSERWVEDVVFELRAPHCESLMVHFSMDWTPRDLVMNCSRVERIRSDGLPDTSVKPMAGGSWLLYARDGRAPAAAYTDRWADTR